MRIEIYCETTERGTSIEVANALINHFLDNIFNDEHRQARKNELAEIAEHIQVFLKYSEV